MDKEQKTWLVGLPDGSRGHGVVLEGGFKWTPGLKIGHYCVIEKGVIIGKNVVIRSFVELRKGTIIGDDCYIDSYVKSSGDNLIGNGVTIRFNATIARSVTIKDDVFISPNVMTIYSRHTGEKVPGIVIGKGAHIGTGAVIGPGVKICAGAVVGALAYVNKDIAEPGVYVGQPAKRIK